MTLPERLTLHSQACNVPRMTEMQNEISAAAAHVAAMPAGEDKALALAALNDARHFARQGRPDAVRKSLARAL
jgi:hypothetical protein